ncbi:hypothetical protein MKW92_044397 [Papaver armeniacum]|nr:hypothetical protein MKW92_044397 [Papaver armeniacum]
MEKTAEKGVIRLDGLFEIEIKYYMEKMAKEAVDRSCGQLAKFSMERFGRDDLLAYIADKSGSLRYLRLVSCYQVTDDALVNMAEKAVMLEELEIWHCSFSADMLKDVGKSCPRLKSFRLNRRGYRWPHKEEHASTASSSSLRNKLTNVGLRAILDGCLHLEYLDLRKCFNVNLEGDLLKRCRDRVIKIRLPNDSTDDYEFDDAIIEGFYDLSASEHEEYLNINNAWSCLPDDGLDEFD